MDSPKSNIQRYLVYKEVVAQFVGEVLKGYVLEGTLQSIIITPPERYEDFYAIDVTMSLSEDSSEMT
jgi:hypothetical protein